MKDIDAVVVSTPTNLLAPIASSALGNGKHVLCEKPLARTAEEAKRLVMQAQSRKLVLKTGFSLRHYPGISFAHRSVLHQRVIGEPLILRCRYGHGGRPGYEQEWRTNPQVVPGGEMLDQGIHIVDLFRWFLGDFSAATGMVTTNYWPTKPLEDNAFAIFRTPEGHVASLHVSWTQWKNLFSLEIFGTDGYVVVDGLGGNYGTQCVTVGQRLADGSPPHERVRTFAGEVRSLHDEWEEFESAIREQREPLGNGYDGWQALRMVYAVYEASETARMVYL